MNVIQRLAIPDAQLCADSNRSKDLVVIIDIMAVDLRQRTPLLEALVDRLVSRPCSILCISVLS